jgi:prophage tail gpP-like protein
MRDAVSIIINGKVFSNILSYAVDSDLFLAADAFSLTMLDDKNEITAGVPIELWVNNTRELYGVIDRVESTASKKGRTIQISGRDLMGMLCSHDITEYGSDTDLGGKTLAQIARTILRDVPYVNYMRDIVFEGKASGATVLFDTLKAEPGQNVFDLLKAVANGRGLQFWCREDGKLVFGKCASSGSVSYRFNLAKDSSGSNVLEGKKTDDLTEAFSKVFVYGQSEDAEGDDTNIEATATMAVPAEFPFYKPKVVTVNTDKVSPAMEAKRLLTVSKAKRLQLHYKVPGHSQNGINYHTNSMARVDDEVNNTHGVFVVCGRTFTLENKKTGPVTSVRLCMPGAFNA